MRRYLFSALIAFLASFPAFSAQSNVDLSDSTKAKFTIGGTFLYLEPGATDADFEYGTVVGPGI